MAQPGLILRVEGLVMLAIALRVYAYIGASWWLFAALFLVPDLSMLGYLKGPKLGAACYNLVHSYTLPGAALLASMFLGGAELPYIMIWIAHIGFDRVLGYGLKYPTFFKDTHLGRV